MPPKKKNPNDGQPIALDSLKHTSATRANIPTEELRDFVAEDEAAPKTMRYPRNPDLDPQLVWKGKDEQDSGDLAVPMVPIYIQEKIHPQALIEDVRASAKQGQVGTLDLFSDFNGIEFDQLIEFYQHNQHWQNRMILGDSLLVMTSLAEKEGLKGQVQMIYLDPPYGIKFGSNWQVSTRKRDVKDGKAEDATRQPEQIKAFRDTWKLGIHSYLAYLRDRLQVARELLTESGSIFVQIGDENVHLVRSLLDEVFGSENFVSQIAVRTTMGAGSQSGTITLPAVTSYILWYGKHADQTKIRDLYEDKADMQSAILYSLLMFNNGTERRATPEELALEKEIPPDTRLFRPDTLTSQSPRNDGQFSIDVNGENYTPGRGYWKTNRQGMSRLLTARRLRPTTGGTLQYVRFLDDFPVVKRNNFWPDGLTGSFTDDKVYVVQSPTKIVARCLLMTTDPGDLVLDPTCGSGTTAYVAEQWGRRWITCDTSRVALALARTRLMAARYPYYYLADSDDGIKKQSEVTGKIPLTEVKPQGDIRKGFVYKIVPHVTLKAIANNSEIDDLHARWQEKLEPLRTELNALLKQQWQEWEIPREAGEQWPAKAKELLTHWWEHRRQRQREIDDSIARNADTETLYDQPYTDNKRVRVTGPFTVESLSPHRVLSTDEERPASETTAKTESASGQFETMILDNLRKAGVQNTIKNERLKFDALEPFAGVWIHAAGEYAEKDGAVKRVAVSLGPEHGTVGPEQVKEAAKEAVKGIGFDLLIVCGFAFDPHVSEEAKRYGKLTVLPAKMNPDLAMGEELLKKTGSGNLFMIFGEPDIQPVDPKTGLIKPGTDGKIQIELMGLDIYDPTTGQIRSNSTADIACWFIDTNYNGESFFVRHAYFTGGDKPYEKLQRALKAEVDEAAWAELYSTKSRPFDRPETGKIAVKVINHYGDEVLKVFGVA
ncbi:MAG: site-specific DNA-methyltransferase [Candidatus Competibacteraceae bacterium]|nr:site-specific DNA-methyltransferase [Candidatus Competibacteraceae bacterium]